MFQLVSFTIPSFETFKKENSTESGTPQLVNLGYGNYHLW